LSRKFRVFARHRLAPPWWLYVADIEKLINVPSFAEAKVAPQVTMTADVMGYSFTFRRRRALLITETELKLMAAAAMMGLRSNPNLG